MNKDVIVLCTAPRTVLKERSWLNHFGTTRQIEVEHWGAITSLRTHFEGGAEIEFGIGDTAWAAIPPDHGTRRVISDGVRIVYDADHLLSKLCEHVGQGE